jgi:hypothetical protein
MHLKIEANTARSVDQEPHAVLRDWLVIRHEDTGCLHFVGRKTDAPENRVRISTSIQEFDPLLMAGRTESGRFYRLEGDPTEDRRPAIIAVVGHWGPHALDRVTVLDVNDIPIAMPARGMA